MTLYFDRNHIFVIPPYKLVHDDARLGSWSDYRQQQIVCPLFTTLCLHEVVITQWREQPSTSDVRPLFTIYKNCR